MAGHRCAWAGLVALGLIALGFGGCGSKSRGQADLDCVVDEGLEICRGTRDADRYGSLTVDIDVSAEQSAFLVTATSSSYLVAEGIEDPHGDVALDFRDWADTDELLTAGIFFLGRQNAVLNWPVRGVDGALDSGRWRVELLTLTEDGARAPNASVDVVTQTKTDDDLSAGVLRVRVVFADGVDELDDVVAATEDAVDHWASIWAAHGLELDVTWATGTVDADLPFLSEGSPEVELEAALGTDHDVTVIVGESIGDWTEVLGEAGGIPGTLVATEHAAVGVSWLANSGADGAFDAQDIRIFGETMAHEVGHYAGLFHPVEADGSYRDALDDTEDCADSRSCERSLGRNNLFPYPICSLSGCMVQDELSGDQVEVLQRYVGVL